MLPACWRFDWVLQRHQAVTTEACTQSNIGRFHLSMQESAEKLTDTCKSHEMHCIYSKKHYFIPYRHADLTWHGTHQFHKEIWALAFEHRVVLLIQHNHNVSCLIARLLQAWELLGTVMIARLTCGFKSWTNMWVQNMVQSMRVVTDSWTNMWVQKLD